MAQNSTPTRADIPTVDHAGDVQQYGSNNNRRTPPRWLRRMPQRTPSSISDVDEPSKRPKRWNMGMLNDHETEEVPGSILLMSKASNRNEPLGLQSAPARTSASSLPSPFRARRGSMPSQPFQTPEKKKTSDGKIVLEPQPEESLNDPLNWPAWRRDCALLSLGFYCMLGGGMTPILAAGFKDVAATYGVTVPRVALSTGLYMTGLGVGSVIASPTAILFGKRPVYLVAAVIFILTAIWCALSPNYASLVVARVFMGIAVSPVECLPSATVAEIFFLHERAYRLGIYTLLLLGGKNLIPLVSAAIIESLGWRWVFWIVAIVVGFALTLLFLFVPETFWDRTPRPHKPKQNRPNRPRLASTFSLGSLFRHQSEQNDSAAAHANSSGHIEKPLPSQSPSYTPGSLAQRRIERHAHFSQAEHDPEKTDLHNAQSPERDTLALPTQHDIILPNSDQATPRSTSMIKWGTNSSKDLEDPFGPGTRDAPSLVKSESPSRDASYFPAGAVQDEPAVLSPVSSAGEDLHTNPKSKYTTKYRAAPPKSFVQTLKPFSGRLSHDNWFRVACRPFILFAYPAILWSSLVYALSVGWLIVLSESVSTIYETRTTYGFTALQAGLIYVSPFVGGILGTAVAGKVSDIIVRYISRKNGGVYEPEFRLIMAIPVAISTTIGLMGYGWSAYDKDAWIVPTIFFGIISFGCSLGSTTAITFAVDSYRQYAGEALVTLNFSKNIFHGLVFSLFFNKWLLADGSKDVFLALGGIQLACLLFTIPMYIYGKRARMWTVRKNLMEKF